MYKEIDVDRKLFLKYVKKHNSFISQYSKYIRPKVPIREIYEKSLEVIDKNVLLTLDFIKSNYEILVRESPNIPNCEMPVQLRKMNINKDLYVIINPFCPEKIALDDAGIAFKKFELLTKRLDILSKQLENESNRDKKDHKKNALKNKTINTLSKLQYVNNRVFIFRIHSFLDVFCVRVKEIKDKKKPSISWQKKPITCRIESLLPTEEDGIKDTYEKFKGYKDKLRDNVTHRLYDIRNLIFESPISFDKFIKIWETYRKLALLIWQRNIGEDSPKYLPELNSENPFIQKEFGEINIEAEFYVWSHFKTSGSISSMNEVLSEFGLKIVQKTKNKELAQ